MGRKRVLLVLLAGKSDGDFSIAVSSLATAGVKIIAAVGISSSFDRSQLLALASSSSSAQSVGTFGGLAFTIGSFTSLISQGDYNCAFELLIGFE